MKTVNLKIVKIALDNTDGDSFEKFVNAFLSNLIGVNFVPLGGQGDGGADALFDSLYRNPDEKIFFQSSIEKSIPDKIRKTLNRLYEVGRLPTTLYYLCPLTVVQQDKLEDELWQKYKVVIKIRDSNFIAANVNSSPATIEAFNTFLAPAISFLGDFQSSWVSSPPDLPASPSVYVFLRNELQRRDSGSPSDALIDGLIVWALRHTDPEKEIFMTAKEILEKIDQEVPGMAQIAEPTLSDRLRALSSTAKNLQRPIRRYAREDKFCLAFDLRKKLGEDNAHDEGTKQMVLDSYVERARLVLPEADKATLHACRDVAYLTIEKTLQNEGLEFAAFLTGKTDESQSVDKYIRQCVQEQGAAHADLPDLYTGVTEILKHAFTDPSPEEQILYSRLGAVYTILFCLRTEPKLIQYFEGMKGHFSLYIGADVLIQALAEQYLPEEQKIFQKTLKLILDAGGQLFLAETVLDEIQHHIFASSKEFDNHYLGNEDAITPDCVEYIDRPLIKSYYYGKYSKAPDRPRNWWQYLNGFCDPKDLLGEKAKIELKKFLQLKFKFTYKSKADLVSLCEGRDVDYLAKQLARHKSDWKLAYNDALMVNVIYAQRLVDGEANVVSAFGSKTWWLTNENTVTYYTKKMIEKEGCRFLMRPDYLLNFLTFLPKTSAARKTLDQLFPSLLGVHLARLHLPEDVYTLHKHLAEAKALDPDRRTVLVEGLINKLKGDHRRPSWHQFNAESSR